MSVHNIMEEIVIKKVDEAFENMGSNLSCTSPECRLDVTCFVLNRIRPQYANSARGMAHTQNDIIRNSQLMVDVITLIHEGVRRVNDVRRPYYENAAGEEAQVSGPVFEFPTIKGRLFSSTTFEPVCRVQIQLLREGALVPMYDNRWQNPFDINEKIAGTFIFQPRPVSAPKPDQVQVFEFEVCISDPRFEEYHHYFTLPLKSLEEARGLQLSDELRLPDLFLSPK